MGNCIGKAASSTPGRERAVEMAAVVPTEVIELNDLPAELKELIAAKADARSVRALRLVNQSFRQAGSARFTGVDLSLAVFRSKFTLHDAFRNLNHLRIRDSRFFDQLILLPPSAGNSRFPNHHMDVSACAGFADRHLAGLRSLTALRTLNLSGRDISGSGLAHLAGMSALHTLNLSGCSALGDAGLAHLQALTSLRVLNLSGCPEISDAGLAHLRGLTGLQSLNLALNACAAAPGDAFPVVDEFDRANWSAATNFSADAMAQLRGLTSLQNLNLAGRGGTDEGIESLAGMTALQTLDLSGSLIEGDGLAGLSGMVALRKLNLGYSMRMDDGGLGRLPRLPALTGLCLNGNRLLSGAGFPRPLQLPVLEHLEMSRCAGLDDAGLEELQHLPALKTLNISQCVGLTSEGVAHLKNLATLEALDLSRCPQIDNLAFYHLRNNTALKSLAVNRCEMIHRSGVDAVTQITSLESLDVRKCYPALGRLKALPHLRELQIDMPGAYLLAKTSKNHIDMANLITLENVSLTIEYAKHLAPWKNLPALHTLDLSCERPLADGIVEQIKDMRGLRTLKLQAASITNAALAYLAELPQLESLTLVGSTKITTAGFSVLPNLRNLQRLELSNCNLVDAAELTDQTARLGIAFSSSTT
jgi:F-box/leucine-rich repeat protein 14